MPAGGLNVDVNPRGPGSIDISGLWRSLVAHLAGGQGVVGSNPASPTKKPPIFGRASRFRCRSAAFHHRSQTIDQKLGGDFAG